MSKLIRTYILVVIILLGCSEDPTDTLSTTNLNPGNFTVNVTNITNTSALLNWTTSIDPEGTKVSYTITLNGDEIASNLEATEFLLENLTEETSYSGKVIAKDEENKTKETSFNFSTSQYSTEVNVAWQKSLGGSGRDIAYAVLQTNDLGYLVAGSTESLDGDVSTNNGGIDSWIVKLDEAGNTQWETSIGGSDQDVIHAIKQTQDGGYIVGAFSSSVGGNVPANNGMRDFWVVKLNSSGSILWSTSIGGNKDDILEDIIETSDGSYVAVGFTSSDDYEVLGQSDAWVVKLDNNGALLWETNFGNGLRDLAFSIDETQDLGYIIGGYTETTTNKRDMWIFKLNQEGVFQWERFYTGSENEEVTSIQQTSDNGYIICGYSRSSDGDIGENKGSLDAIIIKTDNVGVLTWKKVIGGIDFDGLNEIKQTSDGGYLAIGGSRSEDLDIEKNNGGIDFLVIRMQPNGDVIWQRNLGDIGDDIPNSVQETQDGGFIIAGSWYTNISGQGEGTTGDDNFWVIKLE